MINPATPVAALSEVLGKVDHILVMSVNPGFGGQKFIPGALGKIRELKRIRESYNRAFRIEVDGGVGPENVADLVRAGAEILVAGTSIFHTPDAAEAVRAMKREPTGRWRKKFDAKLKKKKYARGSSPSGEPRPAETRIQNRNILDLCSALNHAGRVPWQEDCRSRRRDFR